MEQEDHQESSGLFEDLGDVIKTLGPLFRNRFPAVRQAVQKLSGDALDAFAARLHRYRTHQQIETLKEIAESSGLPFLTIARPYIEQRRIDGLLVSALEEIANQEDEGDSASTSGGSTTDV